MGVNYRYMKEIDGGITAVQGVRAAGIACGIKKDEAIATIYGGNAMDLALIFCDEPATAAGVFTTNKVKAAPVLVSQEHIKNGEAQAIVANSGNANACTGERGFKDARRMTELTARELNIDPELALVGSTGRIGTPMPMDEVEKGIKLAASELSANGGHQAARAIMTTDTFPKEVALEFDLQDKYDPSLHKKQIPPHPPLPKGGNFSIPPLVKGNLPTPPLAKGNLPTPPLAKGNLPTPPLAKGGRGDLKARIGGMVKGAGMIEPNMATMLCFLTTDICMNHVLLQEALKAAVDKSFNMISIDGDMSTNDTVIILANGKAGNDRIEEQNDDYERFSEALNSVTLSLAKMIVKDGEGATKFIELRIKGARSYDDAKTAAHSIARSPLVKTAMFGEDPNWGRFMASLGASGAEMDGSNVDIWLDNLKIVENSISTGFSEMHAKEVLKKAEFIITIDLKVGEAEATMWTCDLSYDYVKYNV